ncbi:MAG: hypothetical protein PHP82_02810 [Candidatus ainarchaeum sp.]|nr:hypothetical protein [Candidatus ainarchaeum sp.]
MIKITFDTNCILRDEKDKNKYYNQIKILEQLEKKGLIEIHRADATDTEIDGFNSRLKKSSEFKEDLGIGVYDNSRYDHCVYAGPSDEDEFNDLKQRSGFNNLKNISEKKKKNKLKDLMILHTHKKMGHNYLISNNIKDFIFDLLNINLINPEKLDSNKIDTINTENELINYFDERKEK